MEESAQIKAFGGNVLVTGKVGYLGNKINMERVGEFGDRIRDTSVYDKFGHILDELMGILSKYMKDELIREIVDPTHDT